MELNLDLQQARNIIMPCLCCTTPEIEMACTKRILEWYPGDQIIIPARSHLLRDETRLGWLVVKAEFDEGETHSYCRSGSMEARLLLHHQWTPKRVRKAHHGWSRLGRGRESG